VLIDAIKGKKQQPLTSSGPVIVASHQTSIKRVLKPVSMPPKNLLRKLSV
jgi:hypothetical protein